MRFERPLDQILGTRSSVRVLRALFELPAGLAVSAREAARRAGVSHPSASSALAILATEGLVRVRRAAQGDGFELNPEHTLIENLALIFAKERSAREELFAVLRDGLKGTPVTAAYLFGSIARGDETEASDIDVAILCAARDEAVVGAAVERVADKVRARFGNDLNALIETRDVTRLRGPQKRLWSQILNDGVAIVETPADRGRARA